MTVQAVNSINFTGKSKTTNGNEYTKSNIGKYVGTSVGLAAGLRYDYLVTKEIKKTFSPVKRIIVEWYNGIISKKSGMSVKDMLEECEIGIKQFRAVRKKALAFGMKTMMILTPLLCAGVALGVGALADKLVNTYRAKKADKANQTIQNDNAKADNTGDTGNTASANKYWYNGK